VCSASGTGSLLQAKLDSSEHRNRVSVAEQDEEERTRRVLVVARGALAKAGAPEHRQVGAALAPASGDIAAG
jgi:hypothetical protein